MLPSTLPVSSPSDVTAIIHLGFAVLIAETIFFWSFITDAWNSFGQIFLHRYKSNQHLLPYRLCTLQAVLGQIVLGMVVFDQVFPLDRCDIAMAVSLVLIYIGVACINGILLFKLLTVILNKQLVALFALLEAARLGGMLYTCLTTSLHRTVEGRCFVYQITPRAAFITAAVAFAENLFLSGLFVWSVYRYIRLVPSRYLLAVLRDGAVYGLAILITSCIAAVVNVMQLLGPLSDIVYVVEWTLASRLISLQLNKQGFSGDSTVGDDDASIVSEEDV